MSYFCHIKHLVQLLYTTNRVSEKHEIFQLKSAKHSVLFKILLVIESLEQVYKLGVHRFIYVKTFLIRFTKNI